jgi:hypothetical protein
MKKESWLSGLLLLVAVTIPAQAGTACFDWSCGGSCSFNAGCSSASPFIWLISWDFGDGSGANGTYTPSHSYSTPTYAYPTVTLTIVYADPPYTTKTSCQIVAANVFGPPLPMNGRCSTSN